MRIIAYSSDPCPYNIAIIDSDGQTRYNFTSNTPKYDKIWDNITDKPGWWEVKAGTMSTRYATAFYNLIPQTPSRNNIHGHSMLRSLRNKHI